MTLVEKEYKGKGIAKSATILLLKYAFSSLKLHTVYLLTETENAAAQKLFQQCGFIKTGIAEKSAVNRGKYVDRFRYQITVSDYYKILQLEQTVYDTPLYQIENAANRIFIKRDDFFLFLLAEIKQEKLLIFSKR